MITLKDFVSLWSVGDDWFNECFLYLDEYDSDYFVNSISDEAMSRYFVKEFSVHDTYDGMLVIIISEVV